VSKYGIGSLKQLGMLVALFYISVLFFVFVEREKEREREICFLIILRDRSNFFCMISTPIEVYRLET